MDTGTKKLGRRSNSKKTEEKDTHDKTLGRQLTLEQHIKNQSSSKKEQEKILGTMQEHTTNNTR